MKRRRHERQWVSDDHRLPYKCRGNVQRFDMGISCGFLVPIPSWPCGPNQVYAAEPGKVRISDVKRCRPRCIEGRCAARACTRHQ
jgi:hypothetical protein